MEMSKILDRLTCEIIDHFRMPKKICYNFIYKRLQWSYGVGYDLGLVSAKRGKRVAQLNTNTGEIINIYMSMSEAAKAIDGDETNISKVCRGKRPMAYGYSWRFVYPEDFDTYKMPSATK